MRDLLRNLAALAALLLLLGCGGEDAARRAHVEGAEAGQLSAFVSIPPQASLVERLGGEQVRVRVMVPPGREPHSYDPTPKQMAALGKADLYLAVGVPFEDAFLSKVARNNPDLTIVHTDEDIHKRPMSADDHDDHDHDHHDHGAGGDPHIWLSPRLLKVQAGHIADALAAADPAHADHYRQNLQALRAELDRLDAELAEALAPYRGRTFFVFHPAFGYLADDYGLREQAVQIEGRSPTPKQLNDLIARAREDQVRIIFVQPQFDATADGKLAAAIDGAVVRLDPLDRDVIANLRHVAAEIGKALADEAANGQ